MAAATRSNRLLGIILSALLAVSMLPAAGLASAFADEPVARPETVDGDVALEDTSGTSAVAGQTRDDGLVSNGGLLYTVTDGGLTLVGFEQPAEGAEPQSALEVPASVSVDGKDTPVAAVAIAEGNVAESVVGLTLPQSITDVDTATLAAAFPNLASVEIASPKASGAPVAAGAAAMKAAYSSFAGILYKNVRGASEDGAGSASFAKELVWAPPATVVARIPAECASIAPGAFADAMGLKTVVCFGVMGEIPQAKKAEDGTVTPGAFTDEQIATVNVIVPQTGTVVPDSDGGRVSADVAVTDHSTMDVKREAWWKSGFASDRITLGEVYGSMTNTLPVTEDGVLVTSEAEVAYAPETTQNYSSRKAGIEPPESAIPTPVPDDDELDPSESGLVFTHLADMTLSVSWKGDPTATPAHLDIPAYATINGVTYPVAEIAPEAFKGAVFLTSVAIPETVKTIGESAFENCANLAEAALPSNLELIARTAFAGTGIALLDAILDDEGSPASVGFDAEGSGDQPFAPASGAEATPSENAVVLGSGNDARAQPSVEPAAQVPAEEDGAEPSSAAPEDEGIAAYAANSATDWNVRFRVFEAESKLYNIVQVPLQGQDADGFLYTDKYTQPYLGLRLNTVNSSKIAMLLSPNANPLSYGMITDLTFSTALTWSPSFKNALVLVNGTPTMGTGTYTYSSGLLGGPGGNTTIDIILCKKSEFNFRDIASGNAALKNLYNTDGTLKTGVSSWNDLSDKPTTFAPSAHGHTSATDGGLLAKSTLTSVLGTNNETYQKPGSYAASNHNHDGTYAKAGKTHTSTNLDDYATATELANGLNAKTPLTDIYNTKNGAVDKSSPKFALTSHNHDGTYASLTDVYNTKNGAVDKSSPKFALSGHNHDGTYAKKGTTHTSTNLDDYALKTELPSLSGYATQDWVEKKGYLTSSSLDGYAKTSDIPSLSGYATEKWVTDKGYLTSSSLNGYMKTADADAAYQPKGSYAASDHNHDSSYAAKSTETTAANAATAAAAAQSTADAAASAAAAAQSTADAAKSAASANKTAIADLDKGKADKSALEALTQSTTEGLAAAAQALADYKKTVGDTYATKEALSVAQTSLGSRIDGVASDLADTKAELEGDIKAAKDELDGRIDGLDGAAVKAAEFGTIEYEKLDAADANAYPTGYRAGGTPSIHEPAREGYSFTGWTWARAVRQGFDGDEAGSGGADNLAEAFAKPGAVTLTANWSEDVPETNHFFSDGPALKAGDAAEWQSHVIKVRLLGREQQRPLLSVVLEGDNTTGLLKDGATVRLYVGNDEKTLFQTQPVELGVKKGAPSDSKAVPGAAGMSLAQLGDRSWGVYVGVEVRTADIDASSIMSSYADDSYVVSFVKLRYEFGR